MPQLKSDRLALRCCCRSARVCSSAAICWLLRSAGERLVDKSLWHATSARTRCCCPIIRHVGREAALGWAETGRSSWEKLTPPMGSCSEILEGYSTISSRIISEVCCPSTRSATATRGHRVAGSWTSCTIPNASPTVDCSHSWKFEFRAPFDLQVLEILTPPAQKLFFCAVP